MKPTNCTNTDDALAHFDLLPDDTEKLSMRERYAKTLAAAVRSRDSLLKTAEEEIAGLKEVLEFARLQLIAWAAPTDPKTIYAVAEIDRILAATKTGEKL